MNPQNRFVNVEQMLQAPIERLANAVQALNCSNEGLVPYLTMDDLLHLQEVWRMKLRLAMLDPKQYEMEIERAKTTYRRYCIAVIFASNGGKSKSEVARLLDISCDKVVDWTCPERTRPMEFDYLRLHNVDREPGPEQFEDLAYIAGVCFAIPQRKGDTNLNFEHSSDIVSERVIPALERITGREAPERDRSKRGSKSQYRYFSSLSLKAKLFEDTKDFNELPQEYVVTREEKIAFLRGLFDFRFSCAKHKATDGHTVLIIRCGYPFPQDMREDLMILFGELGLYPNISEQKIEMSDYHNIQKLYLLGIIRDQEKLVRIREYLDEYNHLKEEPDEIDVWKAFSKTSTGNEHLTHQELADKIELEHRITLHKHRVGRFRRGMETARVKRYLVLDGIKEKRNYAQRVEIALEKRKKQMIVLLEEQSNEHAKLLMDDIDALIYTNTYALDETIVQKLSQFIHARYIIPGKPIPHELKVTMYALMKQTILQTSTIRTRGDDSQKRNLSLSKAVYTFLKDCNLNDKQHNVALTIDGDFVDEVHMTYPHVLTEEEWDIAEYYYVNGVRDQQDLTRRFRMNINIINQRLKIIMKKLGFIHGIVQLRSQLG